MLGLAQPWRDGEELAQARRAAALRDVGKSAIPNAIVEKPAALTQAYWQQMRFRAYHSERVLSRSAALAAKARLAGLHHEREDGSGYHRSLEGSSIPMAARVIGATSALVAMTQPCPQGGAQP